MGEKFDVSKYIRENRITEGLSKELKCKDGFHMSIQASKGHYCSPRLTNVRYWSAVEVGFPSEVVEELKKYAEESESYTSTVYGWVPIGVVEKIVLDHGGVELKA